MAQASPQVEDGYTRIADEYLEALVAADYPASVLRFVLAVVRETWGWQRKEAAIPTKRFMVLLEVGRRRVYQIRDDAVRHNLIECDEGEHSDTPVYRVQKHWTDWLVWKSEKTWDWQPQDSASQPHSEGRYTVKDDIHSVCEDRPSQLRVDRTSLPVKGRETRENKRENDSPPNPPTDNGGGVTEDGNGDNDSGVGSDWSSRRDAKRLHIGPSPDVVVESDWGHLADNYPNLAATIEAFVHWPRRFQLDLFRALVNAIHAEADEWVPDRQAACALIEEFPPLSGEQNLPQRWMQRVEPIAAKRLQQRRARTREMEEELRLQREWEENQRLFESDEGEGDDDE